MRRNLITLLLIIGLIPSLQAQNLLKFEWKFKTGDNSAWAWPEYDDSAWETIEAGTDWENQGHGTYDGFAWYRQQILIPEDLREKAAENGGLILRLARIDDSDVTYFNGQILGSTGGLPPEYVSGYGELRAYTVPMDRVGWGAQNTIAIRVFDGGGGGIRSCLRRCASVPTQSENPYVPGPGRHEPWSFTALGRFIYLSL